MAITHADPVNTIIETAIESDQLPPPSKCATPKRTSTVATATGDEQVCAIDAMAACMLGSSFGG